MVTRCARRSVCGASRGRRRASLVYITQIAMNTVMIETPTRSGRLIPGRAQTVRARFLPRSL